MDGTHPAIKQCYFFRRIVHIHKIIIILSCGFRRLKMSGSTGGMLKKKVESFFSNISTHAILDYRKNCKFCTLWILVEKFTQE